MLHNGAKVEWLEEGEVLHVGEAGAVHTLIHHSEVRRRNKNILIWISLLILRLLRRPKPSRRLKDHRAGGQNRRENTQIFGEEEIKAGEARTTGGREGGGEDRREDRRWFGWRGLGLSWTMRVGGGDGVYGRVDRPRFSRAFWYLWMRWHFIPFEYFFLALLMGRVCINLFLNNFIIGQGLSLFFF